MKPIALALLLAWLLPRETSPAPEDGHQVAAQSRDDSRRLDPEENTRASASGQRGDSPRTRPRQGENPSGNASAERKGSSPDGLSTREGRHNPGG